MSTLCVNLIRVIESVSAEIQRHSDSLTGNRLCKSLVIICHHNVYFIVLIIFKDDRTLILFLSLLLFYGSCRNGLFTELMNSECMLDRDYQGWVDFGRREAE